GVADDWLGLHEDAGHGAVDAGPPAALGAHDVPVRVELLGVLAEVPDVARLVLDVVVERRLLEHAPEPELVVHDDAGDAGDDLRPSGHRRDVLRPLAVLGAGGAPAGAGLDGEPLVVAPGAEVGGILPG